MSAVDEAVAGQDLLDQRRARAWQTNDEDRRGIGVTNALSIREIPGIHDFDHAIHASFELDRVIGFRIPAQLLG